MFMGLHALIYVQQPEAVRAFFRDVLKLNSVDAGEGWLIFAMPPAELGVHPAQGETSHKLYLMCENLASTIAELRGKGVVVSEAVEQSYGLFASLELPGGDSLEIYDPRHTLAIPNVA